MANWSVWRSFPDPRRLGVLTAPFGAGCYELRLCDTREKLLYGTGGHVALRMTSLLPAPFGRGTRRNSEKREYVLKELHRIEYRTSACADVADAKNLERKLKVQRDHYQFRT